MNEFELYGSYEIREDSDTYIVSANIDFKKNKFYCPCLTFIKRKDSVYKTQDMIWDSETYLLKLYKTLGKIEAGIALSKKKQNFIKEIEESIPREDFPLVSQMLAKAISLGFFEDAINEKNKKDVRKKENL